MSHLEPKELIQAKQLIDEDKLDEALTLLNNYEQKEGLNHHDKASCHLLQYQILFWQGKYKKLIKHAEQAYKESDRLENSILKVDSLLMRGHALIWLSRYDEASDLITQGGELLKIFPQKLTKTYKQKEAYLAFLKGYFYNRRRNPGDADLALEYLEHSLTLREELGIKHEIAESLIAMAWNLCIFEGGGHHALKYAERSVVFASKSRKKYYIADSFHIVALVYACQGDTDHCIKNFEYSLELFKELTNKTRMGDVLNNLAINYKMKGDFDRALECIEQSMVLNHEVGNLKAFENNYDFLIQILIDKGDLERAHISLHDMEQLNSQLKDKGLNLTFLLDKALVLKTSLRAHDRAKAEEILKLILTDKDSEYESKYRALLNLCELLLTELRITNDTGVLDEITQLIGQLLEIAEESHSFWILGETYLLQAKLALLSLDLKEARRLLTQGQQIAEKYGLSLLATKISNEHDELLKQLNMWENFKASNAPLNERIKMAGINEQVENMIRRRMVEVSEFLSEEPVFLLIVSEGGKPIFSQSFLEDQSFEDHLLGGFLTAINSFISEIFSEGLDRAIFGEHTLLMKSIPPFFICYVFKGQSYSAQQRIKAFSDKIQNKKDVWSTFEKYYQINMEVQLKDIPSLEPLIKEIFIDKTILLTQ